MDVKWKADTIGRTAGSLLESFIFTSDIQFKCKTDSLVPCTARPGWFQCLSSQGMDQHVRGYHSVSKSVAKYSLNQTKAPVWPQWPPWPLCKWHFCGSGEGISCLDIYIFCGLNGHRLRRGLGRCCVKSPQKCLPCEALKSTCHINHPEVCS